MSAKAEPVVRATRHMKHRTRVNRLISHLHRRCGRLVARKLKQIVVVWGCRWLNVGWYCAVPTPQFRSIANHCSGWRNGSKIHRNMEKSKMFVCGYLQNLLYWGEFPRKTVPMGVGRDEEVGWEETLGPSRKMGLGESGGLVRHQWDRLSNWIGWCNFQISRILKTKALFHL